MRCVLLLLSLFCYLPVFASPLPPTAKAEVLAVLNRLASSGCQFERNGSWYTGTEAKNHLLRKLEYLEGNGHASSAEDFVELAASKSSVSGKPYKVRCGSAPPTESKQWLLGQLQSIRTAKQHAPDKSF